jgi:hypothetical protein
MKFQNLTELAARAANPSTASLGGFNIESEFRTAAKSALKPMVKKLNEYRAETSRLAAVCSRWSSDAYESKLATIAALAHNGDEAAALQIESGAIPTRGSYDEMLGRATAELEAYERTGRSLYSEAAALIEAPMLAVAAKGQAILDQTLDGLGVPRFELQGATNAVAYLVGQLNCAGRGESCDLSPFWQLVD